VLLRKKFTQKQLITFTANMQTCLIGMEACSGAHFFGRVLREQGNNVKHLPISVDPLFACPLQSGGGPYICGNYNTNFGPPATQDCFRVGDQPMLFTMSRPKQAGSLSVTSEPRACATTARPLPAD